MLKLYFNENYFRFRNNFIVLGAISFFISFRILEMTKFSNYIRKLRIEKDFTQDYMAMKLDMSISAYSKLERGQTDPTLTRIEKIGEILGFQITDYYAWKSLDPTYHEAEDLNEVSAYRFVSQKEVAEMRQKIVALEKRIQKLEENSD